MSGIDPAARPVIERGFRLQFEPAQSAYVLLYPEGMIKLNGSAGEILKRCDGLASIADITADLEKTFNRPGLGPDVVNFVTLALEKQWLELRA